MSDLRLALCLPVEAEVAGVAARLRGAVISPPDECDAAMVRWNGDASAVDRLLNAKSHVLLIAEPCPPWDALESLSATARAAGVQLSVVNPDRYLPSRQLIHKQLAGPLGEPGLIRLHRWEPAAPETAGLPDGLLRDLDLTLWLFGRQPERVFALAPGSDGLCVQVHLGFPGGGMALLDYDGRLPSGDGYQSLSAIAFAGAAYADDHRNTQLLYRGGHPQAVRTEERAGQLAAVAQEFVDALRDGCDLTAGTTAWRDVFDAADAVSRSLAMGYAVTLENVIGRTPPLEREGRKTEPPSSSPPFPGEGPGEGLTWSAATPRQFRCAVLSAVKHDYIARGIASHPRFELAVVADDPDVPAWAHERNQQLADTFHIPYVRDVDRALREFNVQVAVVSPEAERHCGLSIRAAQAGKHVVQDKSLATRRDDADRLVEAVEQARVRFLMWNRNFFPAVLHARDQIAVGAVGRPLAVHADLYFAKDAGPRRGSRQPGDPPIDWLAHQIAAHAEGADGALGVEPLGELAVEGIYPLGYIRMLTGANVRRVFARSAAFFHQAHVDHGVEDLASVTLELDGGLIGTLAVGRIGLASHPSGGEIKLRVVGTAGALIVSEARPEVGVYYRGQPATEPRQRRVANEYDFLLADDFARAIDAGGETVMDARASRTIFATVAAALESCRTGQPVEVR